MSLNGPIGVLTCHRPTRPRTKAPSPATPKKKYTLGGIGKPTVRQGSPSKGREFSITSHGSDEEIVESEPEAEPRVTKFLPLFLDDSDEVWIKETKTKKIGDRAPLGSRPFSPSPRGRAAADAPAAAAQDGYCSRARTSPSSSSPTCPRRARLSAKRCRNTQYPPPAPPPSAGCKTLWTNLVVCACARRGPERGRAR